MISNNYSPKNVIRIPKTNILIINTLYEDYNDSSIVYYNDLSSKSGEIINVIKPDYVIIDMKYNDQTDQLVISNYDTLIFADPYTLKALASFSTPYLNQITLLDQTSYILLTYTYNQIQIFDFLLQKVLLSMDNTKQLALLSGNTKLFQYKSALYQLSTGDKIIITSNDGGLICWGIDLQNLAQQFYGYIPNSQKNINDISRPFIKHPQDDVIFIGGNSTQIIAVKIIDAKNSKYQLLYNTYFYGDLYSRRFIWQNDGYNDTIALLGSNSLVLFDKGNFGQPSQYSVKPNLQKFVRFKYGSFYTVKKQNSTYFYKGTNDGFDSGNSYIGVFPIFPFSQGDTIIDITTLYKLQWSNINQNLDPFFLDNNIWVALAFPAKSSTENYLFQLINCSSTNQRIYLKSNLTTDNQVKTAFAVASLEDKNNLELIGVDNQGTVYSWDLSQKGFPFKSYINFNLCKNPIIGDIFHYNVQKRLIISCDDNQVYSFDYKKGSYQQLVQLSSQPLALKAFADPKVVVIGDPNSGIALIYKFDTSSNQFIQLLQLQSSKIQDQLIYIEMLKDYTIWLQYTYSNLFYSLGQCLDNPQQCTQCTQQYNFKATNMYDYYGLYGQGIPENPYTSSANFLTAMIKAQFYTQIVNGVSNIGVDVLIQPDSILDLNKNFMNFDFNSIISLNFKSTIKGNPARLLNNNTLTLQNYNYIGFQDITVYFGKDGTQTDCGISVTNIKQGVTFDNIQLKQQFQISDIISCQKIQSDSTQISILKYQISNEDFTNHQYIISSFNSTKITIQNMSINGSKLGLNFGILQQLSNLNAYIDNLELSGNICSKEQIDVQTVSQLFQAGYFSVKNANILNNIFCKKVIFAVVSSQNQEFQKFLFQNIDMRNNKFQARTQYLLFSALYSMIITPSHELDLNNINFYNNTLLQLTSNDLTSAQYFQTNKIATIQIQQITLQNHFDIQLAFIEYGKSISINNFQCFNDQKFLSQIPNQLAVGCLEMNEVSQVDILNLQVVNKKVQDSSIIIIQNKLIQQAKFQMTQGNFTNIFLNQTGVNTESIPIYVISDYSIEMILDSCVFQNIILNSVPLTITYSSTALFVQNYVGSVQIKNSQFYNSYSNSIYGLIFIQANTFILDTVQFSNSTFPADKSLSMFNSEGGMINVKAQTINISNSNFSKSTSQYGAFIYFESFSQVLSINLISSSFSEGYALNDGSAFFIDTQGQQLNFNSQNCQFKNLYTFQRQASSIGIEKYVKAKGNNQSLISFQGGQIINSYGDIDNYFIDVVNTKIQFSGKLGIFSEDFSSDSLPHLFFKAQNNNDYQFATLMSIQNSNLIIQDCQFKNIYITSNLSTFPLILSSTASSVNIQNTQIFDSHFVSSALYLVQSNVSLSQVTFANVNQKITNKRIIQKVQSQAAYKNIDLAAPHSRNIEQELQYTNPGIFSASLIISYQSRININQNSNFTIINCDQCNGGAVQAIQSTINIQNTEFKQIQSFFGGALFIYGINNTNYIQNTQFISCQAQNDGGGMYLFALQNDVNIFLFVYFYFSSQIHIFLKKFKLEISESKFESNSCGQRGGGIFIDSETLNSASQQIKLQNSQVIHNRAAIGGGIFQQNISTDVQQQNVISSNSATIYGSDQSSYPTQLRISNIDQFLSLNDGIVNKEQIEIHSFRSGANLTSIEFQLLNQKNEIVLPTTVEEEELFEINVQFDLKTQNPQSYIATGQTSAKYDKNLMSFSFSYINLVGLPGTNAFLQFSSKQIYSVDPNNGKFIQNYTFNILIKFRNCGPGEQINKLGQIKECQICPESFYSFNVENCKSCPEGAECHGSTNLVTKQGYWRKSNESDIVLKCSNLLQNCNGGSYGDNICFEGHIGALCEECDVYGHYWPHTYSKSSKFSCTRCDQITGNIWIVSLMTVWTLISMVLAIKGNIEILQEKAAALVLQKNLKGRRRTYLDQQQNAKNKIFKSSLSLKSQKQSQSQPTSDQEKSGVFIKMLTNYIQIVGSIATFNLSIPSGIFEFPQSVGQPLKQTMNSLDCALEGLNTKMPIIYVRLLFSLLIPIIYMLLFLFCMGFYHLFKKLMIKCLKKESKNYTFPWYIITTAIMFLIIYVQPDLVAQIIALLSCRQIGDTQYILSNVSFVCYTKQHYYYAFFLLLPLLLVWVVILPLILFLALKRNKKNLESIQIKLKYGFLYKEYQNFSYYWEFVKMVEKLAIILVLNFYSQSIITKGVLVFMVITVYGILSLIIHPYQESDINEIDVNSTNVCALTVLLGIFIYNNPFDYFVYSSLALIVIINLWFIIKILGKIFKGYLPMIQQNIQEILTKLSKKIPYLNKFIKENNKKQVNPEIKKKFQTLFKKYLSLSSKEKKRILLSTIEFQLESQYGHQLKSNEEHELLEQLSSNKKRKYSQKQKTNQNEEEQINNQCEINQNNQIFIPTIQFDTMQNLNNFKTETAIQQEQKDAATSRLKEQQSNASLVQFYSTDSISNQVCSNNQNQNKTNTSIQLTKQGQQNKKNLSQQQKIHKNNKIESINRTFYAQQQKALGLKQKQEINIYSLDNLDSKYNIYDEVYFGQEHQNEKKMTNEELYLNMLSNTEQQQQQSDNKQQMISGNMNNQEKLINQGVTMDHLEKGQIYSQNSILKDSLTQNIQEVIQFQDEDSIYNDNQYDKHTENNNNQQGKQFEETSNYQNNNIISDADVQRQQKQLLENILKNKLIQFSQNDIESQFEKSKDSKEEEIMEK